MPIQLTIAPLKGAISGHFGARFMPNPAKRDTFCILSKTIKITPKSPQKMHITHVHTVQVLPGRRNTLLCLGPQGNREIVQHIIRVKDQEGVRDLIIN
jgi:hypothetical protein